MADDQDDDLWHYDPSGEWPRLRIAHELLMAQGLISPLAVDDPAQLRAWQDMDLAIMIEGSFHAAVDPRRLSQDDAARAKWLRRLADSYRPPTFSRDPFRQPYWLLRDGQPVGTIALGRSTLGPKLVSITGLYVLPEHRGADVAGRALRAFHDAVCMLRFHGLRLDTYWVWQPILRYYLRRRFWLYMWKHDLTLYWDHRLPRDYDMDIGAESASFSVRRGDERVVLYRASRRASRAGDLLRLEEPAAGAQDEEHGDHDLLLPALSTFSLGLAMAGWPLFQSAENQRKGWLGDLGHPDGLALRIEVWEALARHYGWVVDTPRVPGIAYRGYEELFKRDEQI